MSTTLYFLMRILILIISFLSSPLFADVQKNCLTIKDAPNNISTRLPWFGEYCDVRSDGEHSNGYCVRLFQQKNKCEGYLLSYEGALEPNMALMRQVKCSENLTDFSFETSDGYSPGYTYNGPKTLQKFFNGSIDKSGTMNGTLKDISSGSSTRVKLKRRQASKDNINFYSQDFTQLDTIQNCLDRSMEQASDIEKQILDVPINVNHSDVNQKSMELLCPESKIETSAIYLILKSKNGEVHNRLHYLIKNAIEAGSVGTRTIGKCLVSWLLNAKTVELTDNEFEIFIEQLKVGSSYGFSDQFIDDFASTLKADKVVKKCSMESASTPICMKLRRTVDKMITHAKSYLSQKGQPDFIKQRNQNNLAKLKSIR